VRVELAVEVFDPANDLADVLDLLRCFAEERHDWVADPEVADAAQAYFAKECPLRAASYTELARKAAVAVGVWSGSPPQKPTTVIKVTASELPDLAHDLCRAAAVIVEDQVSDTCFLRVVAETFDQARITTALDKGWLEPRHAGGKNRMEQFATSDRDRFRRFPRVVALLDSDSCYPEHRTECHIIAEKLTSLDVPTHVLTLREVENYVPNRILAGLSPRKVSRGVLAALRTLTPQQRGHFDMKEGFGPINQPPVVKPFQQELYRDLPNQTRRALRGGFGKDLIQQMSRQLSAPGARLTEADFGSLGEGTEVVDELRSLLELVESVI
jgi:hypothetical protein